MVTDAKYNYGEHSVITVNIPEANITLYVSVKREETRDLTYGQP